MSMIGELLAAAVSQDASDIHLKSGQVPFFRIHGNLVPSGFDVLPVETMTAISGEIIPAYVRQEYHDLHEVDFSHVEPNVGRFRVSAFKGAGEPAITMRYVKARIPSIDGLHLPASVHRLCAFPSGLVMLSGTTGSGKSTTLAAIIEEINSTQARRIITVEDPIEYAFRDDKSVITQREVGLDTPSFTAALRHVLRQDPDIILIGEMRDVETVRVALMAAETGHLVLTSVHSGTADIAVPRLLDLFPAEERDQVRMAVASNLRAIVCQRLLPANGGGAIPAVEVLFNTPTVKKLISKNLLGILSAAIETGGEDGMQTFNQSIYQLIRSGSITEKEGMRQATNPEALAMNLKGIFLDEGRKILASVS